MGQFPKVGDRGDDLVGRPDHGAKLSEKTAGMGKPHASDRYPPYDAELHAIAYLNSAKIAGAAPPTALVRVENSPSALSVLFDASICD